LNQAIFPYNRKLLRRFYEEIRIDFNTYFICFSLCQYPHYRYHTTFTDTTIEAARDAETGLLFDEATGLLKMTMVELAQFDGQKWT